MNASWVAIDLMEFAVRTEDAVQSPEAALEWLRSFRDTLLMEGRNSRPMPWAVELLGMADVKIAKKSIARMQGQIVKIYGKDCDVDLECSKKYGEKYEKLKKILAAAATREGVDVVLSSESCRSGRTTGCNNSQEAPTRKAGDESSDTGNGAALKSATSCNHYDQEALDKPTISAKSPAGAGVNLDSTQTIKRPDASFGNAEGVNLHGSTITRNGSRAACTSATSGQTFEKADAPTRKDGEDKKSRPSANNSGEGSTPGIERTSASLPAPTPSKPEKESFGEFGNVKMTSDEYSKLLTRVDNAQALIEELDQYIESQGKDKKYKSHYATLLNWSRRKATEAKQPSRYKNINDINRENCEQIERDLRAMFHPEEVI